MEGANGVVQELVGEGDVGRVVGLKVHAYRRFKEPHDTAWVLGATRSNITIPVHTLCCGERRVGRARALELQFAVELDAAGRA
jgi:hypothetical protein